MKPIKKALLISLLLLITTFASVTCRGQFFWLGFQAGGGVSWFSHPEQDSTLLSAAAGPGFGFFLRYGSRPYYQLGVEWYYSTNQMRFQVTPGTSVHDNVPFHNFRIPLTAGYEIVHLPRFKWRAGGGVFIGWNTILSDNDFDYDWEDIRNPQFGLTGETGIQFLNFLVQADYNYFLSRFFSKDAETYGVNITSHLQVFSLKVGMQF